MKVFTIAAFCIVFTSVFISNSSAAKGVTRLFSPAQQFITDYSLGQSADVNVSFEQEINFPAQFIVFYPAYATAGKDSTNSPLANNKENSSLVLLHAESSSGMSPSWFYLMLVVALLIALLWENDHENHAQRKRPEY